MAVIAVAASVTVAVVDDVQGTLTQFGGPGELTCYVGAMATCRREVWFGGAI